MIGQTIGHYQILEKLGEGGMGVVYKATDTKLDRLVALKFLPDHVSTGSEELERFVQEAKAAAGLNHPNICTIHGIEEADKKNFIVMEYVDGQTLQEKKSSLSTKEALDVGMQIAEGLAAAHEKGIVHRDVKPENIMFRKDGRVQIMDFGLAKLRGASRLTKEGSTVGTAGYMSPEQVQGRDTDHRSDIFSLGVLLYEMLTGQPAFKGMHETAIAYEIVNVDTAPMSSIKTEIPPELDAIVLECLEKDPKERTQSASQVAVDLKRYRRESSRSRASRITAARPATSGPMPAGSIPDEQPLTQTTTRYATMATVAFASLLLGFASSFLIPDEDVSSPVVRAAVAIPSGIQYGSVVGGHSSISPDGRSLVYLGIDSASRNALWIHDLRTDKARRLAATDNATYPFWSADGRSVGFFADGKLKTIQATGGPVVVLADAPYGRGGAWGPDGTIIFCPALREPNLMAVNESGGTPVPVTNLDTTGSEFPRFPSFLPDGDRFVFALVGLENNKATVYAGSLSDSETKQLLPDAANPVYSKGSLLFVRQGILMAQPFDPDALTLIGSPVSIQGNVNAWPPRAKGDFSASKPGILLFSGGSQSGGQEFYLVDRSGSAELVTQADVWVGYSLSPDGNRIAYDRLNQGGGSDIWVYDIPSTVEMRLTFFGTKAAVRPVWSHDGSKIYFNSEAYEGKAALHVIASDGGGEAVLLAKGGASEEVGYYPLDESPDGKYLLVEVSNESTSELAVLDLRASSYPAPLQMLDIPGSSAKFSPDGQWIVYQTAIRSNSGRILVSRFMGSSGTWQVSPVGDAPDWSSVGISFFSTALNREEIAPVSFRGGTPIFGAPEPAITGSGNQNLEIRAYSEPRGSYLGLRLATASLDNSLSLIINWPGLVEEQDN